MNIRPISLVAASICACSAASTAQAQVVFYDLFFSQFYQQQSPLIPTTPYAIQASVRIFTSDANDTNNAFVVRPDSAIEILEPDSTNTVFFTYPFYATEAEMLAAFPAGTYQYNISGGNLGDQSGTIDRDETPFFSEEIPAFTPSTYEMLQSPVDTASSLTIEFNPWIPPAAAEVGQSALLVYSFDSSFSAITYFDPTQTSLSYDPDFLPPGEDMAFALYYTARQQVSSAGFLGATSLEAYDRATVLTFTTLSTTSSCPADFTGDTFVDDSDFVIFAAAYEQFTVPPADQAADLTLDGFVDDSDFVLFAQAYEEFVCP
jgi:hypothetical protein